MEPADDEVPTEGWGAVDVAGTARVSEVPLCRHDATVQSIVEERAEDVEVVPGFLRASGVPDSLLAGGWNKVRGLIRGRLRCRGGAWPSSSCAARSLRRIKE